MKTGPQGDRPKSSLAENKRSDLKSKAPPGRGVATVGSRGRQGGRNGRGITVAKSGIDWLDVAPASEWRPVQHPSGFLAFVFRYTRTRTKESRFPV